MKNSPQVILITGPAGTGKTTLAQALAQKLDWQCISEDDYWVKHDWLGDRSEEQETLIQTEVIDDLLRQLDHSKGVVLEFILYKKPPNPLTNYRRALETQNISYQVACLKPSVETIMSRIKLRGRTDDLKNLDERRQFAENQLACLGHDSIDKSWIIDPSDQSVEQLCDQIIANYLL